MTLIQKIRLQGFKSFPKLTELIFPAGFSCILGPNGSGKTNLTDSICFVLGKSSSKELRAEKASHLIYNGGKKGSPYKEAFVEVFFDNSNGEFPIKDNPIKISRTVKQTGVSTYRINDKVMTREQILDLLNHAKIDPDGHNIVLQGDVVRFIEMKPVERREVIEDISGISVYEDKKRKSLMELEKVSERLKEAEIILTEREANLRELKKERDEALKYKEIEEKIKDSKATYINLCIEERENKKREVEGRINNCKEKINKIDSVINKFRDDIKRLKEEIKEINNEVEEKGEKEQLELRKRIEIARTDLIRTKERLGTCRNEVEKIEARKKQLKNETVDIDERVKELKKKRENIEAEIKGIIGGENRLKESISKLKEKNEELNKLRVRNLSIREFTGDLAVKRILELKEDGVYGTISQLGKVDSKYELALGVAAGSRMKSIIVENDKIAEKCIRFLKENKLGIATFLPLNKIEPRENSNLRELAKKTGGLAIDLVKFDDKFKNAFSFVFGNTIVVKNIEEARKIGIGKARMVTLDGDLIEQAGAMIGGFRRIATGFSDNTAKVEREIKELSDNIYRLENKKMENEKRVIGLRSEINKIDIQIESMLIPEGKKTEKILLQHNKELNDFKREIKELEEKVRDYEKRLREDEDNEKRFHSKARDLINKRNKNNELIQNTENRIQKEEENKKSIEDSVNELSINRAKVVAEIEGLAKELEPFKDAKILKNAPLNELKVKIQEYERTLKSLGSVNLRALDVYDSIEKEHQELLKKADKLKLEKDEVLNVIAEIESKKKDIFMRTLDIINNNFKKIFSNLSAKGEAHLELENPEEPFNAGLNIRVKFFGNKLLDIYSLSGGEQTLTVLAFIFAIQEYDPASFYLFDEVDAALDKVNSELLSKLIKKYSNNAQYIVISHNDALITEADQIYGVSMQDGISKIISLKV
ncbi:MAG: AAA family ATPase [Nanoarchaeota archaeon]